jgi:hypothetical protein
MASSFRQLPFDKLLGIKDMIRDTQDNLSINKKTVIACI